MSETTKTLSGNQYLVTHTVGHNQPGIRLDQFLMQRYRRRSREQLKRAIESGAIAVVRNSTGHQTLGKIKASFTLLPGDVVHVLSIRRPEPPVDFNYQILHEDDEILVIHKPANLPVHPAGKFFFHTLLTHLKSGGYSDGNTVLKKEKEFYLVHRIDKETSGVLLIAKTKTACANLTAQFANRETEKYYLAIVHGKVSSSSFDVNQPINKKPGSKVGLKMYPLSEAEGGLPSLTHFELVEHRSQQDVDYSLIACFPRTGRQHQIRVHADFIHHPLVGDKIYGLSDEDCLKMLDLHRDLIIEEDETAESENFELDEDDASNNAGLKKLSSQEELNFFSQKLILPRHALHAAGLRFRHPATQEMMTFESDLPDDLRNFFESITGQLLKPFRTKHW